MDSCQCCQAKLEEIATDGHESFAGRRASARSRADGHFGLLAGLEGAGCGRSTQTVAAPRTGDVNAPRDVSLDFLQPATDTAYLGPAGAFRRDARPGPRRHGRGARSVRLAAAAQCGPQGARSRTGRRRDRPAAILPRSSARPRRSRTKTSWPCIRSKSRATTACPTWSCSSSPANRSSSG